MKLLRILTAATIFGLAQSALAYTIDGQISDWGVTNNGWNGDWTPNSGVEYAVSDQYNDSLTGGYVHNYTAWSGYGGGGQQYDAEAIYLDYDSTYLYFAVVTGRPQYVSQWQSGDIAFDFGSDGSYEYGIETRGNNGFSQGDLVQVSNWSYGYYYPNPNNVDEMNSGTVVSSNDFVYGSVIHDIGAYTGDAYDDHYVMEGRIALADFSLYAGQNFTVHWTMGCGNDEIHLSSTLPTMPGGPGGEVPIPGTGLLLGSTLLGWTLHRRRRNNVADADDDSDGV